MQHDPASTDGMTLSHILHHPGFLAGAVYEWWMLYYDQDFPSLPAPPSSSEQLDSEMRNRFAQEEVRLQFRQLQGASWTAECYRL